LTRRTNQWHNAIIATIVKSPRGEIRRGLFRWPFSNRTTAARHDAAISPCTCLGIVSVPSSEPYSAGPRERAGAWLARASDEDIDRPYGYLARLPKIFRK
jgi:hypothetical protein